MRGRLASLLVLTVVLASGVGANVSLAQSSKRIRRAESPLKPLGGMPGLKRAAPSREGYDRDRDRDRGARRGPARNAQQDEALQGWKDRLRERNRVMRPRELRITRARAFRGDLRDLPHVRPTRKEKPEREAPPSLLDLNGEGGEAAGGEAAGKAAPAADGAAAGVTASAAAAPAATASFDGLDFQNWGSGRPPDTVGDVGKDYYIQAVNSSVGIYRKSDNVRVAAFTFDTLMSQGNFGNLCDTDNFGDPVVLYDTFEDRWVLSDFAFTLDAGNNVINPPGAFQCFAVSQTGDPVAGGWNFYSINTTGGLGDYPKLGVWPDGIYMSVNMFNYAANGGFQNARVYALNKAQMYAGAPSVQVVSFDAPASEFSLLPSNARLQTGTPPPGAPNYFSTVWNFANVVSVWKFHVDWKSISLSTFTGPFDTIVPAIFAVPPGTVPASGSTTGIETLGHRLMMQNQYTNLGGVESLWNSQTVRGAVGQSALRYYQVNVNGGAVAASPAQAFTYNPDATNRLIPSLAVDRAGNMALGYSATTGTTFPSIRYAGRLATDAANSITQTETTLIAGGGSQTGTVATGGQRWGDYSAMTVDPDGCTFWFTSQYFAVTGRNWLTRVGSFSYPQCTPVGNGGVQGTVTASGGGAPLAGATVALGSRTTTTDAAGAYSFTGLPAGTYPVITAGFPGYNPGTTTSVVVAESATTTVNFVLDGAQASACVTDTAQADFQTGVPTTVDLTSSPGDVTLLNSPAIDQQNTNVTTSGFGFNATNWVAQTFTASATGQLTRVDVDLFCSGCTGTTPNLTVSIRNTAGNAPAGADLATATISGFSSSAGGYFAANFAAPATLTAGTRYAIVVRPTANPSPGLYAYVVSAANPYVNGQRATSANSGASWTLDAVSGGRDLGFRTYMKTGFGLTGNLVSGAKDANPSVGSVPHWGALSWTADTPAGTAVTFQAAASNSAAGPFNFVGPDGTSATFFAGGASLAQFNGLRYLKYRAHLSTTNTAVTPTLNDVTICFANLATTNLSVAAATGTYGGTADLSATLTSAAGPVAGKSVAFTLNGAAVGSATTDGSGVATLPNVSLAGIDAGSYPAGVGAGFAGDAAYLPASATNALTVNAAASTITWGNPADIVYGTALGAAQLNATASVAGTFVYTPAAGTVLNAGNGQTLHVDFTPADTVNYAPASADVTINVLPAPLTIKADDKSRLLGEPNPPFTATYAGFVNGEGPGSLAGTLTFSTTATPASPAGNYPIIPGGVSSTNYSITFVNGTLSVGFNVCVDYDQTQEKKSGSTIPIKLRLCDASGADQSSSSVVIHADYVVNALTNAPQPVNDAGNSNPGGNFRHDGGGYVFNLKTTGYPSGTYKLGFTVAGDPTPHTVQFVVK